MNDEVRDMISMALRDEPPVGVSFDAVLAAGRRRRTRRQLGIVGGAALGVAAIVSSAVVVGNLSASPSLTPGGPTTGISGPRSETGGCVLPARKGGFGDPPSGQASAEELAESARLTEALARFAFPLPAGVTMDPAKPKLCVIVKSSFGTEFTLHSAGGDRVLYLEVRPRAGEQPGRCAPPGTRQRCRDSTLPDGTSIMATEEGDPGTGAVPVLAGITAWRADGTFVRVLESGPTVTSQAPRVLDTNALIAIATAPQLKVGLAGPGRPAPASEGRAAELTAAMKTTAVLPAGVTAERVPQARAEALAFFVSQGGYKLNADLTDRQGSGNLFINLSTPDHGASVGCHGESDCDQIILSDGRTATVSRTVEDRVQRVMLSTLADDHTLVTIMASNLSAKAQSQNKTAPSRATPPLSADDLIRIASAPWLHW